MTQAADGTDASAHRHRDLTSGLPLHHPNLASPTAKPLHRETTRSAAEISNRWKKLQESVADNFESLHQEVRARRADRAAARADAAAAEGGQK